MPSKRKSAFTLTELLVVVVVLGVLAAVAAPKFARVLETRKTTEAEDMLSAVRSEQEHRCAMGKNYTRSLGNIQMAQAAGQSANYTFSLDETGAAALRKTSEPEKSYAIKMLSYKDGTLCCEGEYCTSLNKDYPPCDVTAVSADECAATDSVDPLPDNPSDPCVTNPNSCACNTYASAHQCECAPGTSTCCEEGETWNSETKQCDAACEEKTEYIGTASAEDADTCNGDRNAKFSCDGSFKGTCIDVYAAMASSLQMASYASDPFWNFDAALAQSTTSGQCPTYMITCPKAVPSQQQWCCPKGTQCKSIGLGEYECVTGDPGLEPEELCTKGYHKDKNGICVPDDSVIDPPIVEPPSDYCPIYYTWDPNLGKCVDTGIRPHPVCENGYVWSETEQKCLSSTMIECGEGCFWSASLKQCVCSAVSEQLYEKRRVTCCGTGEPGPTVPGIEVDRCLLNPNQQECCKPPQVWNGQFCVVVLDPCAEDPGSCACDTYAKANPCKCNPSASTCCTEAQIKGGMTYNASTKSCACPTGTKWDVATKTCKSTKKYTCWGGYSGSGKNFCDGVWQTVYALTSMTCGNASYQGTVSCKPGQQCECTPGKKYLWYETYGCADPFDKHSTSISAYTYYCLSCVEVDDLSQCPKFTIPRPNDSGFGGGNYTDPVITPGIPGIMK